MDLQFEVLKIIKDYKYEIIHDKDWWHGLPEHDINIYQKEGEYKFTIDIYTVNADGNFYYDDWQELPSLTFMQILLL